MEAFIHGENVDGEGAVALPSCDPTRRAEDAAVRPQSEKRIDFWRDESQRDCQRRCSERHSLDGSQQLPLFTVYFIIYPQFTMVTV